MTADYLAGSVSVLLNESNALAPCPGDTNDDRYVNTADLAALLSRLGQQVPPGAPGDINHDGLVTTADLTTLLGAFGTACP